jgi:hypothetical protein
MESTSVVNARSTRSNCSFRMSSMVGLSFARGGDAVADNNM